MTGMCNISENCSDVSCNLKIQLGFTSLPVTLSVILQPCQSPFAIYVNAKITFFDKTISLADGIFSANTTIPFTIAAVSGTVHMVIIQEDCGILLSVSSHPTTQY